MLIQAKVFFVSLAHRYWHTLWSPEENRKVYGALASAQGVGSNFRVTLSCETPEGPDFTWDGVVGQVRALLDHRCLFTDHEVFRDRPSTLENVTLWLGHELIHIPANGKGRWSSLEVFETETVGCELRFSDHRLRLKQKIGNLWLTLGGPVDPESGLMVSREQAARAVERIFPRFAEPRADQQPWLLELFNLLRAELPMLEELAVDLGRQKALRIALP